MAGKHRLDYCSRVVPETGWHCPCFFLTLACVRLLVFLVARGHLLQVTTAKLLKRFLEFLMGETISKVNWVRLSVLVQFESFDVSFTQGFSPVRRGGE